MKVEDVITETEFNTVKTLTYEKFCDFGNRVVRLCVEEALKNLPHVITSLINQASHLKALSEDFYKRNKDLADDKELVARTIERIDAENPGLNYETILSKAAPRARQALSLKSSFKEQ